jgi:hypothetical protein
LFFLLIGHYGYENFKNWKLFLVTKVQPVQFTGTGYVGMYCRKCKSDNLNLKGYSCDTVPLKTYSHSTNNYDNVYFPTIAVILFLLKTLIQKKNVFFSYTNLPFFPLLHQFFFILILCNLPVEQERSIFQVPPKL